MASTNRVRLGRGRAGPLQRRSDRVEAWAVLLALVLGVLGAAATAVLTWSLVRGTAEEQRTERHQVSAVALKDADAKGRESFYKAPGADTSRVPVRWPAPDGTVRQGTGEVPDGTRTGDTVPV
ncbi:hypothetical protein N566_15740, partial [Streptomycetaceae bacterium MP113-05]